MKILQDGRGAVASASPKGRRWALALVGLLLTACGGGGGAPPSARTDPLLSGPPYFSTPATCADVVAPGTVPGLTRWPYLQSVEDDAITIAWGGLPTDAVGTVVYGRDAGNRQEVLAHSTFVSVGDADIQLFHARLEGLGAGTEYCYGVEVDGVVLASGLRFRTAPRSVYAPLRFLVIGDYGAGSAEQRAVRDQLLRRASDADLLLTTGDNAYPAGSGAQWQEYVFDVYRSLLTSVPFAPALGNHDYATADAEPFLDNLFLPEQAWNEDDEERYYAFDWGPAHVVVLDTEDPLLRISNARGDDMADWLAADLASTRRPWKLVFLHRPPYATNPTRNPSYLVRERLVPIFEEHGVQVVFSGHNHYYERFHPLRGGEPLPVKDGGIVYVTTGGGGAGLYDVGSDPLQAAAVSAWHFLDVRIEGDVLDAEVVDLEGATIDRFRVER